MEIQNIHENPTQNLDYETYELYDRNIRLWGKQNQIK